MIMKSRHHMIHCIIAVASPPDFGVFEAVEFKMLTVQRNSVNKKPIRPGTESTGRRKLICKSKNLELDMNVPF